MTSLDQFVLDAALRAAVVLSIAWCVSRVLAWGRCSAALRHRLWTLALAGTLAVPLLMGILPALEISVPALWVAPAPVAFDATSMEFNADGDMLALAPADESPPSHSFSSEAVSTADERALQSVTIETGSPPASTPVSWLFVFWSIGACADVRWNRQPLAPQPEIDGRT